MTYPDFLIDKRLLKRNLERGVVKRKELDKLIAKLPDMGDNAEYCPAGDAADDDDRRDEDATELPE